MVLLCVSWTRFLSVFCHKLRRGPRTGAGSHSHWIPSAWPGAWHTVGTHVVTSEWITWDDWVWHLVGLSCLLQRSAPMCVSCLTHGEHLVNCGHYGPWSCSWQDGQGHPIGYQNNGLCPIFGWDTGRWPGPGLELGRTAKPSWCWHAPSFIPLAELVPPEDGVV